MEITSLKFIIAIIAAIFVYYLLNYRFRIIFLVILSCLFIASYSYILLIYTIIFSFINFYLGYAITITGYKKTVFWAGIVFNLSQLVMLRYYSFALEPLFDIFNVELNMSRITEIIIPVGISFFTLQGIGYLINIKMKWEKPEKNFFRFLLYIIFFPKFLSGPIERSNHFLPQLAVKHNFDERKIIEGLRILILGLFKKVAIANQLAPFVNGVYGDLSSVNGSTLWLLLIIQPVYLYFDFSGYTDIAIGLAKTFGFDLLSNFNRPFLSENVTSFWKRFHMSLSSWFNDYIFRQTSFRYRKWGISASIFAIIVTWLLFGIWHGAGWNFMLLGLLQALAIIYEYFTKKWRLMLFSKMPGYLSSLIGRILTYLFYAASLVFFFASDLKSVSIFFSKLFELSNLIIKGIRLEILLLVMLFVFIFLVFEIIYNDFRKIYDKLELFWLSQKQTLRMFRWALYFVILSIIFVFSNEVQQFIYFQF
ncbi:MAG: MBOAT family protein [Bacteroidales bacterium]|nr:MBOAT family protein [Bacteroidales bacterium]